MGCDIHAHYERRVGWTRTEDFELWADKGDAELDRQYELFALLAGVRNDGYNVKPISEPKGLAPNMSEELEAYVEGYSADGHSHSYLTLAELKAADLQQEIEDDHLILSRDEKGQIESYCGSTTGPHEGPIGKRPLFGVFPGSADQFHRLIQEMEALKLDGYTDEDVRLVFFFDN